MANCAIDIGNVATSAANDVMMIVSDATFVQSRRTDWLDATNDTMFCKNSECVIYRLARDCSDIDFCFFSDHVGRRVGKGGHCAQDSHSLSGDMEPMCAKNCGDIQMHSVTVTDSGLNSSFDLIQNLSFSSRFLRLR